MSFVIKANNGFVSLIANKILTYTPDYREYYISNSNVTDLNTPYNDVEQALDDFEYETSIIPKRVIISFKNKIKGCEDMTIKTSTRLKDFIIEEDDDLISLIHEATGYQLNYFPPSTTISGQPEFSVTTLEFEPIKDYEVLANGFMESTLEAINIFEAVVGELPFDITRKFKEKIKVLENSKKDFKIENLGDNFYSYTFEDEILQQLVFDAKNKVLSIDFIDKNGYEHSQELDFKDFSFDELKNLFKDLSPEVDTQEVQKVLKNFEEI